MGYITTKDIATFFMIPQKRVLGWIDDKTLKGKKVGRGKDAVWFVEDKDILKLFRDFLTQIAAKKVITPKPPKKK